MVFRVGFSLLAHVIFVILGGINTFYSTYQVVSTGNWLSRRSSQYRGAFEHLRAQASAEAGRASDHRNRSPGARHVRIRGARRLLCSLADYNRNIQFISHLKTIDQELERIDVF
jgi:hypothetical protein